MRGIFSARIYTARIIQSLFFFLRMYNTIGLQGVYYHLIQLEKNYQLIHIQLCRLNKVL